MMVTSNFAMQISIINNQVMKRTFFIIFIFLISAMQLYVYASGDRRPISLERKGGHRSGTPMYNDAPQAYYDAKEQIIIIDGGGAVSYYDVEITSPSSGILEIATTVGGNYDTFDISSLSAGSHTITIETPTGHVYEGTFTSY